MNCDLCHHDDQLTEHVQNGEVEHLCSDCFRWSEYWDSLDAKARDAVLHQDGEPWGR